ncbi:MAG: phenylalanine 4-monooxygenase [Legionellaceae bacterium]|nr:phenylalanine 4-monooxygenase [Legionellaceae bacterium]
MSLLLNQHVLSHAQLDNFTQSDHETWRLLFARQIKLLKNSAASEVITGLEKLAISQTHIPKFSELNATLENTTGFSIVPVKGLIPDDLFFKLLSERKFPSTSFIRQPEQLDYLEEPDIFHDIFGHIPLLIHPIFADFMQAFGEKGLEAMALGMLPFAAALYWFTVEFGLICTQQGLRIYGAGILSSPGETVYALNSIIPSRVKFNVHQVIKTHYHIDAFQKTYFVIESFQELFDILCHLDWQEIHDREFFV